MSEISRAWEYTDSKPSSSNLVNLQDRNPTSLWIFMSKTSWVCESTYSKSPLWIYRTHTSQACESTGPKPPEFVNLHISNPPSLWIYSYKTSQACGCPRHFKLMNLQVSQNSETFLTWKFTSSTPSKFVKIYIYPKIHNLLNLQVPNFTSSWTCRS